MFSYKYSMRKRTSFHMVASNVEIIGIRSQIIHYQCSISGLNGGEIEKTSAQIPCLRLLQSTLASHQ